MKTLLIICTLLCLGYNQLNIDTEIVHIKGQTKRDYAKVLYPLLEKFYKEKRLTDDEIIKIIPTSEEEFGEYYSPARRSVSLRRCELQCYIAKMQRILKFVELQNFIKENLFQLGLPLGVMKQTSSGGNPYPK